MPYTTQYTKELPKDQQLAVDYVALAKSAAAGDRRARQQVNELAHPMVSYQTDRFCKRFCAENKYLYRCTLAIPCGNAPSGALFCEWGNASYAWMLNELTHEQRLLQYEAKNGARLQDYMYHIANSLPFYERWKDWRFGRRVRIPDYVKEIDPDASRVFLAMRSGDNSELIAQKCNISLDHAETIAQKIVITLTKRHKLHLLNQEKEQSLSQNNTLSPNSASLNSLSTSNTEQAPGDMDIAVYDPDPAQTQRAEHLQQAWQQLTVVEQFVMEAMVIDEQDANDVLQALKKLNVQISDKVSPENTDRQQLYYFRRKTLAKLASLLEES